MQRDETELEGALSLSLSLCVLRCTRFTVFLTDQLFILFFFLFGEFIRCKEEELTKMHHITSLH